MVENCTSNSCIVPEGRNESLLSNLYYILKNPHSKCLLWNSFLVAIIIVVFGQVVYFDFVYYDDFVYTAGKVDRGNLWSWDFLKWVMTSMDDGFWAPITKISHRLDIHLFGYKAGGHHAINLILHVVNSLLLWRLLCMLTGDGLVQFLAVCIFAIHPLRVEPVVWIASRKDLLSTLFLLLMLMKYVQWVGEGRKRDYCLSFVFFVASAMSKPVSMVFPLFLPILDFLLLEKGEKISLWKGFLYIPFLIVSIILAIITLHAEQEAIIPISLSLMERLSRMVISTALYFLLTFLPVHLHTPYGTEYFPLFGWTKGVPVYDRIDIVLTSLIIVTLFVVGWVSLRRQYRKNFASLCIFLLPLVPVIGVIPFGHHLIADRFTYASHIGLCLLICITIGGLSKKVYNLFNTILIIIVIVLSGVSILYVPLWERGEKLFRHSLKFEPNNYVALCNLGFALIKQGRCVEAIPHLQKAIEVYPYRAGPYNDLAFAYQSLGRYKEAINLYNKSIEISGEDPEILSNIAFIYYETGNYDLSREYAEKALSINPNLINTKKILELLEDKK